MASKLQVVRGGVRRSRLTDGRAICAEGDEVNYTDGRLSARAEMEHATVNPEGSLHRLAPPWRMIQGREKKGIRCSRISGKGAHLENVAPKYERTDRLIFRAWRADILKFDRGVG